MKKNDSTVGCFKRHLSYERESHPLSERLARSKIVGLRVGLQIASGDVGGGDGEETLDDDRHTELSAVTCDLADDSLEVAVGDDDSLSTVELTFVLRNIDVVGILVRTDNLERLHLTVGDDERLPADALTETDIAVVEAEMREVDIVVDVGLENLLGTAGKQDIGQARLLHLPTLAVDHPNHTDGGMEGLDAMRREVLETLLRTPVGGTEHIPTRSGLGERRCRQGAFGGHPCR